MNTRKQIRLQNYDYSENGAYFITICTKDKQKVLCKSVGTTIGRPQDELLYNHKTFELSEYGKITENAIKNITLHYPMIIVDKYVIMPNHIHMILMIDRGGRPMVVPTISVVISQLKGYISKQIGHSIWQSRFIDHVIRNEKDYFEHLEYIENNPLKWEFDKYYK